MDGKRIIIGESDEKSRRWLKESLTKEGYLVVGEAGDGVTTMQLTRTLHPDAVVIDMFLPGMNGVEVGKIIEENKISSVILICDYARRDIIDRLKENWFFSYIFRPMQRENVFITIEMAISQFEKFTKLEKEIDRLKGDIETRKIVDRAKGLLIKHKGLNEEEAFKFIQKQSMNKRISKKKVAEAVILTYDL